MSTCYNLNEIDFNNIKFVPNKSKSSTRFVTMTYNKKPLIIKMPRLRVPFNTVVSKFGQLEIVVSLGKDLGLIEKIKELDTKMIDFAIENNWFNTDDFSYIPVLKESKNSQFPPTIKMKVNSKDNEITSDFFDINKERLEVKTDNDITKLLPKGTEIFTAIDCVGVWIRENKFGLTLRANQVRIMTDNTEENGCDFDDTDSDIVLLIDDDE